MKTLIEWLEKDKARTRKFVLLLSIFVYLLTTVLLFVCAVSGLELSSQIVSLFTIFTGLLATVYGFFTGTSSDKSTLVADKAADILLSKMNDFNQDTESKKSAKPEEEY